jgi:ATP-dependent helicase/nuclease subunit A
MTADFRDSIVQKTADAGKSVHLSASAGSGKTRALKERYLALLDRLDRLGLNADQVVAITFTDKAAAEIKERVLRDLPEAMLKRIIRGTEDLRISTIHSFCMNLLKRYPLEAGLPPDFGILDSRDQAYKIRKSIEDTLEKLGHDADITIPLGTMSIDVIIARIEYLISARSRLKRMEIDAGGPEGLVRSIRHGIELDTAEARLRELTLNPEWRSSFEDMEQMLEAEGDYYSYCRGQEHLLLARPQDLLSAGKIAEMIVPVYFTVGGSPRKTAGIPVKAFSKKGSRPAYEKLFFNIQKLLLEFTNASARLRSGREILALLRLYLQAEENYRRSKLREALLDFDDLEIYAYRLLQGAESPDILYWLDRKILHYLVDEFQDTSDIQWAILRKLTEEIFSGQGADKPMPPTLFVVGDEKQSIYRFREADYRLLHTIRQQMEKNIPRGSREIFSLEKNYRSTSEIVATVNRVFSGLWGELYTASEPERKEHSGSVTLIEVMQETSKQASSPATEAAVLASELQRLVQSGTMIYERTRTSDPLPRSKKKKLDPSQQDLFSGAQDDWLKRPAGYGDCAILIQSRTKLKEYEAALQEQGVPYRVVGGIGFYEEDEIQAIINILFFLRNRDDVLSLVAALKSPLFGLTEADVYGILQGDGNLFDMLKQYQPGAWRLLNAWTGIAKLVPISALIHRIVGDTGAYVRFGANNPQAVFNIDKLLDTAREFDRRGYTTLQDFVEWVRNIRQTEQREATSDMNLPGFQGSVSIMTVHKAKGLEYPIVFLPGMNQAARSLTIGPEVLIREDRGRMRIAIRGSDNPAYEDLWTGGSGEQEELRREHQRLLYVAITRARDHLVMLGTVPNTGLCKQNTWLDFLHQTLPIEQDSKRDTGSGITQYAFPDWRARTLSFAGKEVLHGVPAQTDEHKINIDRLIQNISPIPLSHGPEWKRATDFIEQKQGIDIEIHIAPDTVAGISPLTRGSVLHQCLEEFTTRGNYDLDRILKEYPDLTASENLDIDAFRADIRSILDSVLNNDDFGWIFKQSKDSHSELPFLFRKEHILVAGQIDRLAIRDDTGFVIDYKAIRIENDDVLATWINHYRPQLRIYCEAAKELFGLKNVEGYLLFLDSCRLQLTIKV